MKINKEYKIVLNKFWKNRNKKQRSFIIMVILPLLISSFYYVFLAANVYVVETKFAVKGNEMQQVDLFSGLAGMPAQGGISSDSYIVQEFIGSSDIVTNIQKYIDLDEIFNNPNADFISRLGREASLLDKVSYWRKKVTVSYDPTSTIITLKVRSFDPEDAQKLALAILKESEILINTHSETAREDDLKFARSEVARAENRVKVARLEMNNFRTRFQDLDPKQTASAKMLLIGELEVELAKSQAELTNMSNYMDKDAPAVLNLNRKIDALKSQINTEKNSISVGGVNSSLAEKFADYEPLLIERTFAEKAYTSTLASLEAARVEAAKKHRYISTFVAPTAPDEALEPNKLKSIITVFLVCFIAWSISLLGLGIIKEHIGWV